jgi:hypothetical protein
MISILQPKVARMGLAVSMLVVLSGQSSDCGTGSLPPPPRYCDDDLNPCTFGSFDLNDYPQYEVNGGCPIVNPPIPGFFPACSAPVQGGTAGACLELVCSATESNQPADLCVHWGMGRINCCSQAGCATVDGMNCSAPTELNGVSCDPFGIEPPGQPGQTGVCSNGVCLAGLCTSADQCDDGNECTRDECDPSTGACASPAIARAVDCGSLGGGFCAAGLCITICAEDPDCGFLNNPCAELRCGEDPFRPNPFIGGCYTDYVPSGALCYPDPSLGVCDGEGNCVECVHPSDCPDDGNECTWEYCPSNACATVPAFDGTPCSLGACTAGVCLAL